MKYFLTDHSEQRHNHKPVLQLKNVKANDACKWHASFRIFIFPLLLFLLFVGIYISVHSKAFRSASILVTN